MTDRTAEMEEGPAYHAELSAFAAELTELWIACGKPATRNVLEKRTGVSGSTISEAFTGKRLPKREALISIVQVMLEHARGQRVAPDDPKLKHLLRRQRVVDVLRTEHQRRHGSLKPLTQNSPPRPLTSDSPPPTATIPELESAKGEIVSHLSEVKRDEEVASRELLLVLTTRDVLGDEIRRLRQLLIQELNDKGDLRRKITALEMERAELSHRIAELTQVLMLLGHDRLGLTESENELNDRRAELYFAWARSEEVRSTEQGESIQGLKGEVAGLEEKLKAAEQLIITLGASRHL